MKQLLSPSFFLFFFVCFSSVKAIDHSPWNTLLQKHVRTDLVNYKTFKTQLKELNAYLNTLESLDRKTYDTMSKNQQMAFLINAYNAFTVKLILNHYPVKSIRSIGGFFRKPWSIKFFNLLGGSIESIDPIEHEYLRPIYKDYRIHAAVNCASISCPVLRGEAYSADKLEQQLDEQMTLWLKDSSRNRVDDASKTIFLSKIFDWYKKDFVTWGGGVEDVLIKHAPSVYQSAVKAQYKIRFLNYDWNLNDTQ
jgi:hypothetical protein